MAATVAGDMRFEGEPTKGSRFIATVTPVGDEAVAKEVLQTVRNEMPDAGHHCWAWRLAKPAIDRASDDGEPSGSAGKPILSQLVGRDLVDTALIVSRYWGGTKLGVGGLVRAYGGAAAAVLDRVQLLPWVARIAASIRHDHSDTDSVMRTMKSVGAIDVDVGYGSHVNRLIEVPDTGVEALRVAIADATSGRAEVHAEFE